MANYDEVTLLKAVTTVTTGPLCDVGELTDDASVVVTVTSGAPTFSVTVLGSADGVTFTAVGTAIAAAGQKKLDFTTVGPCRYFKGQTTALSGGGITAALFAIGGA